MLNYFPKFFTSKAITIYIALLITCNILFYKNALAPLFWVTGIIGAFGFFYFSNQFTRKWSRFDEKKFIKKLFQTGLMIRILWVVISYIMYTVINGDPFEWLSKDAKGYHDEGSWVRDMILTNDLGKYFDYIKGRYSDMGYPFFLGWQYLLTGKSIIIARLIKAILGSYTCVFLYKLATRNFGQEVGRMAAIFCMLMPNLILYVGLHTKEVEMLFLTAWFMERADWMFRNKNFNFVEVAPPLLLAASLFFFRTVIGITALFAMFTTIMFSSTKVINAGKRVVLFIWILGVVVFFMGGTISTEVENIWKTRGSNQEISMKARSEMVDGNKFAKYFTGAIFAPMIFIIPLPTLVATPNQENQQIINGGNYVKNIMAFFVLMALIEMINTGKWREYVLISSFTIGYLLIIAMSAFAQAERFHQPAIPFEMILAAYGLSVMNNKTKRYYNSWMVFMFIALIGWNLFKLVGKGLV